MGDQGLCTRRIFYTSPARRVRCCGADDGGMHRLPMLATKTARSRRLRCGGHCHRRPVHRCSCQLSECCGLPAPRPSGTPGPPPSREVESKMRTHRKSHLQPMVTQRAARPATAAALETLHHSEKDELVQTRGVRAVTPAASGDPRPEHRSLARAVRPPTMPNRRRARPRLPSALRDHETGRCARRPHTRAHVRLIKAKLLFHAHFLRHG